MRPPVVAAILIVVTGLLAMPPTFARDSPAPAAAGAWTVEPVAYFGGSAPPDLALDSAGTPSVLYCPPGDSRLAVRAAAAWTNEHLQFTPFGGICGDLALGPDDTPHATTPYATALGCVAYGVRLGGGWDFSCFPGGVMDAVDSLGRPHAVTYWTITATRYDLRLLWRESDGSWQFETVEPNALSAFPSLRWYSMALDAADHPRILYYDSVRGDVRYASRDASGWHVEVVEHIGALNIVGREGSLALAPDGTPHAAYTVRTGPRTSEVRYAVRGSAGWASEAVSRPPPAYGGGGLSPSVAVGAAGPVVLYGFNEQLTAIPTSFNYDLIFAAKGPSGWEDEIAYDGHLFLNVLSDPSDDDLDAPQFPAMVLDHCGNPHAAVYLNNRVGAATNSGVYYLTKGECSPSTATASLRVEPRTLNLRSKGKWITAMVTLEGATTADVALSGLAVNGVAPDKVQVLNDTVLQLKVSREDFMDTLPDPPKFGVAVAVTLTGKWKDGGDFTATDTIRILKPGR